VCYDDRRLRAREGDPADRLVVVEFKRPGIRISSKELQQVMLYKNVFASALGSISSDNIEVVILGDEFDVGFDREALKPAYQILSYEELLANARDRYRELYERLAPDGVPPDAAREGNSGGGHKRDAPRRKGRGRSAAQTPA
jgi:hypothetical protein